MTVVDMVLKTSLLTIIQQWSVFNDFISFRKVQMILHEYDKKKQIKSQQISVIHNKRRDIC